MHGTLKTVSFKLTPELDKTLTDLARRRRSTRSAVLREAVEALAKVDRLSVTALAGDLVGSLSGPGDLATNPKYMEGFGE